MRKTRAVLVLALAVCGLGCCPANEARRSGAVTALSSLATIEDDARWSISNNPEYNEAERAIRQEHLNQHRLLMEELAK